MAAQSTASIPCAFCGEVTLADAGRGLVFARTGQMIALPSLGCFVRGYSLIVPRRHETSFANLESRALHDAFEFAESLRTISEELFGPTIIAEHGTGPLEEPTAACCDHAHLHMIPISRAADIEVRYREAGGNGVRLGNIDELREFAGQSYLSLSTAPQTWTIWKGASRFPRQFARRAAAEIEGAEGLYDWRRYPFPDRMYETTTLFQYALKRDDR